MGSRLGLLQRLLDGPWPNDLDSRFALKGSFADVASRLRVDRMVFFWGGGFDLGGAALRKVLSKLGAVAVADSCHLANPA